MAIIYHKDLEHHSVSVKRHQCTLVHFCHQLGRRHDGAHGAGAAGTPVAVFERRDGWELRNQSPYIDNRPLPRVISYFLIALTLLALLSGKVLPNWSVMWTSANMLGRRRAWHIVGAVSLFALVYAVSWPWDAEQVRSSQDLVSKMDARPVANGVPRLTESDASSVGDNDRADEGSRDGFQSEDQKQVRTIGDDDALSVEALALTSRCSLVTVYLIQGTPLPDQRLRPSLCRRIVWLDFRDLGKTEPLTVPGEYDILPKPGCSWTEGRNALLEYALGMDRTFRPEYFIFLDADILRMIEATGPDGKPQPNVNPWERFEQFLVEWKPAVGYVAPYSWQTVVNDPSYGVTAGQLNIDANLNAFHRETVGTLLPYVADFDQHSWHLSQLASNFLVSAFYADFRIGCNTLKLDNRHNVHSYGSAHRGDPWHIVKQSFQNLFQRDSDQYRALEFSSCGHWDNQALCNWAYCPRRGDGRYRISEETLRSILRPDHPVAQRMLSMARSKQRSLPLAKWFEPSFSGGMAHSCVRV